MQVLTPPKRAQRDVETPVKDVPPAKRRAREKRLEIPEGPSMLSDAQKQEIRRLVAEAAKAAVREGTPRSGNVKGLSYDKVPTENCVVCGVYKHHVKWGEMRVSLKDGSTLPRGGQCYACTRAAVVLGAKCRSVTVFSEVEGALAVWRVRSALVRQHLRQYAGDCCTCSDCTA